MPDPFLSIIFPAHNEENRLIRALDQTIAYLESQAFTSEILVIENGSTDQTLNLAQEFSSKHPSVRVFHTDKAGKGLAIQQGMLSAHGDYRFACDVDLSMPVTEINRFIPPMLSEDIVIASREASGAIRYNEPGYRHFIGRIFNGLVRLIALHGIRDSQCGFKCFSRKAAEELFPLQTIMGWTYDVEILFIARKKKYRIIEIGIPWYHDPNSKVRVLRDSFRMLTDLFLIRWNHIKGSYATKS